MTEWYQSAAIQASMDGSAPKDRTLVKVFPKMRRNFRCALVVCNTLAGPCWRVAMLANYVDSGKPCEINDVTRRNMRSLARAVLGAVGDGLISFYIEGNCMHAMRVMDASEHEWLPEGYDKATEISEPCEWTEDPTENVEIPVDEEE